jgi:hypothetical protein
VALVDEGQCLIRPVRQPVTVKRELPTEHDLITVVAQRSGVMVVGRSTVGIIGMGAAPPIPVPQLRCFRPPGAVDVKHDCQR